MGILQFETPRDRFRKEDRERRFGEALDRFRQQEQEFNLPVQMPIVPGPLDAQSQTGFGRDPSLAGIFDLIPERVEPLVEPTEPEGGGGLFGGGGLLGLGLGGGSVSDIPIISPPTSRGGRADVSIGEVGGILEEAERFGRETLKREVIEPVVPEFDLGRIQLPKPPGIVRETVFDVAGVPEEERPALRQRVEEAKPLGVQISSATVEEAASWVLDPTNLVFFAGPALRAAGGTVRLANRIRKTKNVPNFIRAAMRTATEETATGPAAPYILALRKEKAATESTITALRSSGQDDLARDMDRWIRIIDDELVTMEGRRVVAPAADVGAEAALAPTAEEISGLASIKLASAAQEGADIGAARARPLEAPLEADVLVREVDVFAERGVADVGAAEGLISSQVLEPRPVGGPAILSTRLPNVQTPLDNALQVLGAEAGGGRPFRSTSAAGLRAEREIKQEVGIVEQLGDENWVFADGLIVDISSTSRELPTARISDTRGLLGERYGGFFHTDVSIRFLPQEERTAFYRELDELAESPSDLLQFDWDARDRFGKFTEAVSIQKQSEGTIDIVIYGPLSPEQKVAVEQAVRDAKVVTLPPNDRFLLEEEAIELGFKTERIRPPGSNLPPGDGYWSVVDPEKVKTITAFQGLKLKVDRRPSGIVGLHVTLPSRSFSGRVATPTTGGTFRVTPDDVRAKLDELDRGIGPGTFPGPEPEGVVFRKPTEIGRIEEAIPTGLTAREVNALEKLQAIKGKLSNKQKARLRELESKRAAADPEPFAPNPFEIGGFSKVRSQTRGPRGVAGGPSADLSQGGFGRGGRGGRFGGGRVAEGGPPFEGSEFEEAAAKLAELVKQAKLPLKGQTLLRQEELGIRFKEVERLLRKGEGTPEQIGARAKGALAGPLPQAQFEPVRPFMTEAEVQLLYSRANTFDFGFNKTAENVRTIDALTKILTGELPQKAELELLGRVYGEELLSALLGKGKLSAKIYRNAVDLLSLPKTALTILDHSFPGRQGIKLLPSHPSAWTKSTLQGLRAMGSKKTTLDLVVARATDATPIIVQEGETIRTIPFGQLKEIIGVFEAPFGATASIAAREEAFISRWARLIPGVKLSERAFLTSGNEIRHSIVRKLLMEANKGDKPIRLVDAEAIANLVNRASGRGTLGPLNELAPIANAIFFAPRYRVSSPQWAATLFNFGRRPAQKEAVKQIISFVGTGATVLALLEHGGLATVNLDPTSADFGKGKVGNTRIDFWAHMQQIARAVAMAWEGERLTSTGERIPIGLEDVAYGYWRSGLSPFAALINDAVEGATIVGEEIEGTPAGIGKQAFNRLVPLVWQDIIEGVREEGIRGGIISSLALGGIGVQTYETFAQQRAKAFKEETGLDFDYNNSGHWAILRTNKTLVEGFGELGDRAQETQDFLSEEMTDLGLPEMAQRLSSGTADPQVYIEFREAWEDFEGIRANSAARLAFGRDRDPADDAVFQRYIEVDRNDPKYKDPTTFEIDYGAYRRDKDAAFEKIDPAIQEAFLQVGAPDPGVAQWATAYTVARNLRRDLYAMSKWEGLTVEQSRRLDTFSIEVRRRTPQIALELGRRVKEADVAKFLAEQQGMPGLAEWFVGLQSSSARDRMRNVAYGVFLGENFPALGQFYPELYSQASLERLGFIEEEESTGIQAVQPLERLQPIGGR